MVWRCYVSCWNLELRPRYMAHPPHSATCTPAPWIGILHEVIEDTHRFSTSNHSPVGLRLEHKKERKNKKGVTITSTSEYNLARPSSRHVYIWMPSVHMKQSNVIHSLLAFWADFVDNNRSSCGQGGIVLSFNFTSPPMSCYVKELKRDRVAPVLTPQHGV